MMGASRTDTTAEQGGKVLPLPGVEMEGDDDGDSGPLTLAKPFLVWRWIRDKCEWPPNVKMAYWVIYTHRNRTTGLTSPSLAKIAKGMGCTAKAAIAAIQVLEQIGALSVVRRREPDSKEAAVNQYDLRAPWEAEQRLRRAPRGKHNPRPKSEVMSKGEVVMSNGYNVVSKGNEVMSNTPDGCVDLTQQVMSICHSNENDKSCTKSNELLTSPPAPQSAKPRRKSGPVKEPKEPTAPKERVPLAEDAQAIVARFHELRLEVGAEGIAHAEWGGVKNTVKNVIQGKAGAADIPAEEACQALEWAFRECREELDRLNDYGLKALRSVWSKWRRRGEQKGRFGQPRYERRELNEFEEG